MRLRAKVDDNQRDITEKLRAFGASVLLTHMIGKGAPDMIVGYNNKNWIFEIKDGRKPPSSRKLTEDEKKFHADWKGQISVIENANQAINILCQG